MHLEHAAELARLHAAFSSMTAGIEPLDMPDRQRHPAAAAASPQPLALSSVAASGFSTSTGMPRSITSAALARCASVGTATVSEVYALFVQHPAESL